MAKNLKQASAAAIERGKVASIQNLDRDGKDEFTTELSAAEQAAGDFIQRVKKNITEKDIPVTGKIEDINIRTENNQVLITGNAYLLYQSRGTNPKDKKLYDTPYQFEDKKPPVQPILDWIKRKNINASDNESFYGKPSPFEDTTEEQAQINLAYAIRESIYSKKGLPPLNFWDVEIPKLVEDLKANAKGFIEDQIKHNIYNKYGHNVEEKGKK